MAAIEESNRRWERATVMPVTVTGIASKAQTVSTNFEVLNPSTKR